MNRLKNLLGVTLLEIMLVLAIAAMVIVMSIRYYSSATASQQANAVLEQIQGIVAAADSLAQGTGSYTGTTTTAITPLLPANVGLQAPWGSTITIGSASATGYQITVPQAPAAVCPLVVSRLASNTKFTTSPTTSGGCSTTGPTDVTITYSSTG